MTVAGQITDEQIAMMLAAAEKATPGPRERHVIDASTYRYVEDAEKVVARDQADADFNVLCDPQTITALLTELQHRREAEAGSGADLARAFHEAYERLAPQFGYETRADTKTFDPSTPNGQLMTAVCAVVARPMVEALNWYAEQGAGCRKLTSDGDAARQALDRDGGKRARDALAASPASGVRVKALEWHDESHHDGEGGVDWWMQADTPFGPITLTHKSSHTLPWLLGPFRPGLASNFRTQDEAKAAAQADYEARVRSALGEHP